MQNNQKTSNIHTHHNDNKNKPQSYQNNKQLSQQQHNLQPHQRQSIKGLFTFYREQEQNQNQLIIMKEEIQSKQRRLEEKCKEKIEGKKGKGKVKDVYGQDKIENDLKEVIMRELRNKSKNSKGQRKTKKNKNQSMLQDSVYRAKKRKKGKKSTRESTQRHDPQNISQQQKNEETEQQIAKIPEEPAQQFLKIIKQRKLTKSPKLRESLKTQPQNNINININTKNSNEYHLPAIHDLYSFDKGNFNKLFYPKQSSQTQLLLDDVNADLTHYQYQNRFVQLEGASGRGKQYGKQILVASIGVDKGEANVSEDRSKNKKKIVIDQIFLKRSSSQIQKSLSNRKRMHTQSQKAAKASQKTTPKTNSKKDNIYSHTKLKQIVQLANRIGLKQESQPISPPTHKNLYTQPQISLNYQNSALKLPVIRNVRLSRQLRKIEQIKNEESNRYGTNKSKNSENGKPNKSVSRAVIHEKLGKSKSTHHYRQYDRDDIMNEAQRQMKQNKKRDIINETNEVQREKEKQPEKQKQMYQQKQRQRLLTRKKLETQPEMYCLALIDLSKSVNSGVENGDRKKIKKSQIEPSWSMKKKILFKKLGLQA